MPGGSAEAGGQPGTTEVASGASELGTPAGDTAGPQPSRPGSVVTESTDPTSPASRSPNPGSEDPANQIDGLDAAPTSLERNGATYRRVGAVPWFQVAMRGDIVAVTTGPETRGACDTSFYRLTLGRDANEPATLTSYEYAPVDRPTEVACVAIGLPPAVATFPWPGRLSDVTEVRDGTTGRLHPLQRVLVPPLLPSGFTADVFSVDWPQVTDDSRPTPFWTAGSWSGPAGTLTLVEHMSDTMGGRPAEGRAAVRGAAGIVVADVMTSDDRCLSWKDPVTGNTMLCSVGAGGRPPLSVAKLVELADSLAA